MENSPASLQFIEYIFMQNKRIQSKGKVRNRKI